MKSRTTITLFLPLLLLLSEVRSHAQTLLAGWDFQTTTNGGTAILASPNTPTTFFANFGTQAGSAALYLDGTHSSSSWVTASTGNEVTGASGSTLNTSGTSFSTTTTSPAALSLKGGTSQAANGKSITFTLSTTGYQNLTISYAAQRSSTGFNSDQWSYSLDGGSTFTNFGSAQVPGTSYSTITMSALSAVDNSSSVILKYTFNGATGSTGSNFLDNIQFNASAIPEPSTYAAIFGAGALGFAIWRRRQKQKPATSTTAPAV